MRFPIIRPILWAILLNAVAASCCREVENQFDGGIYIPDAGDAGLPKASVGCPLDQVYNGICWCEPNFKGCSHAGFCFYSSYYGPDAGCIHVSCGDDDDNCGSCNNKCKTGTHCSESLQCVAE